MVNAYECDDADCGNDSELVCSDIGVNGFAQAFGVSAGVEVLFTSWKEWMLSVCVELVCIVFAIIVLARQVER